MVDYDLPGVLQEDLGIDVSTSVPILKPTVGPVQLPKLVKPALTQPRLKPIEGATE
jgi:hypothetical protein